MSVEKAYFNWSSGKDASLALYYLNKKRFLQTNYPNTIGFWFCDLIPQKNKKKFL